ncbi:radical SAM protein [Bacteroides fluxus]|uniref:radical SAM protein n=1 Tax=Bacteroides fluxus TaxID=626930 RepID=UPI002354B22D|nr:radical SAM protein [Bacteroides fluxus]
MGTKYYLNPDYTIRKDGNRYLLHSRFMKKYDSDTAKSLIHPYHARLLSLFSAGSSVEQAANVIASDLNVTQEDAKKILAPWLTKEKFKIKINNYSVRIPKNVLVPSDSILDKNEIMKFNIPKSLAKNVDLSTKRLQIPYLMTFMLTNTCVTKCCYCYADTHTKVKNYLLTERIFEIIREAKRIGVYNIFLIGGEVFLHPDWELVLKELTNNGFGPDTISTKIPITPRIVKGLKESGFKGTLQLSIDTLDSNIAIDTLHVNQCYISKVEHGINLLEKAGITYRVETVLTKATCTKKNIDTLYNFLKEKNCVKTWEIRTAMFSNQKSMDNFNSIKAAVPLLEELFGYVEENIKNEAMFTVALPRTEIDKAYYSAEGGSATFKGAKCSALNDHLFILPDGKCTICEQLYWNPNFIIGDLTNESISEVWNSTKANRLLNLKQECIDKQSPCSTCKLFDDCFKINRNRCWTDVIKAYGDDKWDFPDPRCKFAPKMNNNISYNAQ